MQHVPGRRVLALVAALVLATAGSALAQDTTDMGRSTIDTTQPAGGAIDTAGVDTAAVRDTTDTSNVQNPPGYRGMERDTTMFPPQGGDSASPGRIKGEATGTYEDSASRDTSDAGENDGYRAERPAAADSAAHDSMQHGGAGVGDSTQ